MKFLKKAKRGFTLVELVVVIAVIAILAAVSVGAYFGVTESANKSKLEQESKQFQTAIQTVALVGNENHTLSADGLRVSDIDKFELALEETVGQDIEVLDKDPTYIAKQTLVLKTSELVKSEEGAPVVYKTFEYYTAEISGKKIAVDVVTGDFAHATSDVVINKDGGDITNNTIYFKAPAFSAWIKIHLGTTEEEVNSADNTHTLMSQYAPSEDIYSYNVSSEYTLVKFSWEKSSTDNTREYTSILTLPDVESKTPYYNNGWVAEPNLQNAATTGKTVYFNDPSYETKYVYAYKWNGENNADWPGEQMTIVENRLDGMASYTFKDDYYLVIFNNGNNGKETPKHYLDTVDFSNAAYYNHETKTFEGMPVDEAPEEETKRIVYFANPSWEINEEKPMTIYAWGDNGSNGAYPGVPMIKYETIEHLYYFEIEESYPNILFSAGGDAQKTQDINFNGYDAELGYVFYDINSTDEVKWTTIPEIIYVPEITPISIVGTFNGWNENDTTHDLTTTDGNVYTIEIELEKGAEFKFIENHAWTVEYAFDSIDNTLGELEGEGSSNAKVKETGTFTFILTKDAIDKKVTYTFNEKVYPKYTLTINSTIENTTVTLTADGFEQNGKEITVNEGTIVAWSVSKEGYISQSGSETVTEDKVIDVTLEQLEENHVCSFENGHECDCGLVEDGWKLLYLEPNSNRKVDNARFAARCWNDEQSEKWYDMSDDDNDGIYECWVETSLYDKVIFARMNPNNTANNWDNKRNQTGDLTIPTDNKNLFVVTEGWWDSMGDDCWRTK